MKPSYHLYVLRVPQRDEFMSAIQAHGIGVGVHFRPVHLHQYYRQTFGFRPGMFPIAEAAGESVVSLPLYASLRDADVDRVVAATREILSS